MHNGQSPGYLVHFLSMPGHNYSTWAVVCVFQMANQSYKHSIILLLSLL